MSFVVIASTNPVKIQAVKNGFQAMFPDKKFHFYGVSVSSNVSHQPMSDIETEKGALSRVKNAKVERPDADFWVGIEGGVGEAFFDAGKNMEAFAWVVIESRGGLVGKGKTGTFMLPPKVAELIRDGKELGEADDIVFGQSNSKQKMGAVGLLTNNVIDRTAYYTHAVILALIRFTSHNKVLYSVRV